MMKKIIISFAFLLFITNSFAQDKKIRAGLQFSNGISFMKSDNTDIIDTKVGYAFNYGLVLDYFIAKNYAIGTGLSVSHLRASRANSPAIADVYNENITNGSTFNIENGLVSNQKEIYKFTYVEIPVTFKLKTNEIGYFRYFGEFGILNSFRVRSRIEIEGSTFENESVNKKLEPFDIKSGLYNASLKVGGGFEYTISDKTALLVELSFNNGFVNVLKDGDDKRSVLRVVNLTTGILF